MLSKTLVVVAILIVTVRGSPQRHCKRQRRACKQYEQNDCDSRLGVQTWESCCQPAMDMEGSGRLWNMQNNESGIYTVKTGTFSTSKVYCDMDSGRGGWLTILRRTKSEESTNFHTFQEEYEGGFGDLKGDFWLGLRTMHLLSKNGDCEMRVDLYDENNTNVAHVSYNVFKVEKYPGYQLYLKGFDPSNDSLTDSLSQFSGRTFTVSTHKEDEKTETMCAHGRGGWWYKDDGRCSEKGSVLTKEAHELEWWVKDDAGIKQKQKYHKYEMKIRPQTCWP